VLIAGSGGNVGIGGGPFPPWKLQVITPGSLGLMVHVNTGLGTVASFGDMGRFEIDSASTPGGRLEVTEAGNVGIGTNAPDAKLHVVGNVHITGNVVVGGTVAKGGGAFRIDHPLDPENKYLYHSFVESPDMKNIYDGVAALDANGEAMIELPEWFEALNRDFRYQLTCMHGFAPVYVDQEISANHFKIAGGKPGMKVSWQVTGIRRDTFANEHRIPVEEEKPAAERRPASR
jgi:hypothetical protein